MDEALKYAERFYGQCYLETLDNMTAAQKFYESCGFRRIEEPVVQTEHFLLRRQIYQEYLRPLPKDEKPESVL